MNFIKRYGLLIFLAIFAVSSPSQNLSGIKICVNPGHGGYDSDDRNVVIAPFTSGDPNGFWESKSNLDKGLMLKSMLENAGATVIITRTTNTTADDLPLSQIVAMANSANADYMLSIHSNAGNGIANYVLQLYAGLDPNDTYTYPTPTPFSDESRAISTIVAQNLYSNQITNWSATYAVRGDKTFARTAMGWSDGYGVLRGLAVPGAISEGSMHDYIPETYRLMNMEYKWLEAWHFFKSFCQYYQAGNIPTGNIAGSVRDSRNIIQESYYKLKDTRDELLPLNGATLTLLETNETYTTDQLHNGVYMFKNLAPGVYHVKAEANGYHAQIFETTVTANNTTYLNIDLNKVRNTPPQVISYSPNIAPPDSAECSTDIVLTFNWDMDVTSTTEAFSITPSVEGTITFEDSQRILRFKPLLPLEKATLYTVRLAKTAKHPDNLSMTEDFTFQFLTKNRNRLKLLAAYPYEGNHKVYTKPQFRFIFDRVLNTSNLQTAVKVLDKNGTELTKNARSVLNNKVQAPYGSTYFELTNALTPDEEYKVLIAGNVKDEIGMPLVEPIEINFKASNVLVTDQPIVEKFETTNSYSYSNDQSLNVSSASVSRNTSKKLFEASSYLFSYSFSEPEAYATYLATTLGFVATHDKVVGLHVYGDLSGNSIELRFVAGAEVKYVKLCDLNFFGWEFVETKLDHLQEGLPYEFTGFRVVRNEGILSGNGELYFDNMLLYDEPIMAIPQVLKNKIQIYPNPASNMVMVKTSDQFISQMQLYSLQGKLLKETNKTNLDISNVAAGTYVLKIKTEKDIVSFPLIIVH
ncbi:MAG TPA: N-acetylmuramoyl-L-alanine amidase [Paludibacteraceae bacterium]|nr:N-acetylmuramoyl-L-alanine amidase [Paludibacteraceae bacterium]HQF10930.1 N-acetylmuramoyl-L-alanine amidase [Paludibacteraceae bacterium]HRS23722.1 N-acetylmuramoyl-L-alanine amidase [Paludibacteraceae bacterium]